MHPQKISCYVTSNLYKQITVFKVSIYISIHNLKYFRLQSEDLYIVYPYKLSTKFVAPFCSLVLVLAIMENVNQKALYRTTVGDTKKIIMQNIKKPKRGILDFLLIQPNNLVSKTTTICQSFGITFLDPFIIH